ncbi:MAG TPA: protein kinase [Candidatus Competibacteraceae bacterium]|nr:protein kinase [Candidatus Competibacteraceae bacterium]HRZ07347.1 protein kinase [Candidatus Competibacteraceae bacterium]
MTEFEIGYHLPVGYRLEEFEIQQVVGEGSFGIVYLAHDHILNQRRAIKEFLPPQMAARAPDGIQVNARTRNKEMQTAYRVSLRRFIKEAQMLAALDHPNIVRVYRCLEANGTVYLVMPYYPGETLEQHIERAGSTAPDPAWVQRLLERLLDGLAAVHACDLLHRDIKPANIYLVNGERPVLLDFGAARQTMVQEYSQSFGLILTQDYAAIEQYGIDRSQDGPWTDLYALGATFYQLILGKKPPPAAKRILEDNYLPLIAAAPKHYPRSLVASIDRALAVRPRNRYLDTVAWLRDLQPTGVSPLSSPRKRGHMPAILIGLVVGVGGASAMYSRFKPGPTPIPTPTPTVQPARSSNAQPPPPSTIPESPRYDEISLNVDSPANWYIKRMIQYARDRTQFQSDQEELSALEKPSRGDRRSARPLNDQAIALIRQSNYAEALPLLEEAHQTDPRDEEIADNLGFAYLNNNEYDKAKQALVNALYINSERSTAWQNLGDAFAIDGDEKSAINCYINFYFSSRNRERALSSLKDNGTDDSSPTSAAHQKAYEFLRQQGF